MDNEKNNNNYKFLIEKPSKKDLFDSGSHSRTANAVFRSLKDDNGINVVGVEGNLGSGKSTVLELIKDMSCEEQYEFVEFDVEKFQHGATKKALIEKLYLAVEGAISSKEGKAKVEKAKNVALGNHFEYTSNIKSNINIWIVWFTISLLVGIRLLPDALTGLGDFLIFIFQIIRGNYEVANENFSFSGLSLLSVILVLFPWHIVRCAQKRKKILWLFGTPPTTGDIFKRNSNDTISETIEINKEVGAYELQQALESFVFEIPDEKRFILVLDNLDRVTKEKLREVWSDIEVFTSIAQTKIQLLIPYSITHVASSLSSDETEGMEFISKRIPISFRVAPILSADWKSSCSDMITETGITVKNEELKGILTLIDLWTYAFNTQVTPRYMKKLINSVVSILATHSERISVITAFYYQLSVQNSGVSSTEVLASESTNSDIQEKLKESKKIIERIIDFEFWSKELVSIHYLSSYNIAESEILTSPLRRALDNTDIEPFMAKQSIYAYDKILLDLIDDAGTDKFISLILLMKEEEDEKYEAWVDKWYPHINSAIEKDTMDIEDIDTLVSSTQQLINLDVEVSTSRVERYYNSINGTPSEVLKLKDINETLEVLYGCSQLLENIPNAVKVFNANMFIEYLWPNREKFPNWNIGVSELVKKDIQSLFSVARKAGDIDKELLEAISNCFRLGWLDGEVKLDDLYSSMPTVDSINDGTSILESNLYNKAWYATNQFNYYHQGLSTIEKQNKAKWLAQALSNMIYHNTPQYISNYEPHIELNDEFHKELANCFVVSCDFDMLLTALEHQELREYVFKAIGQLVENRRVFRLSIDEVIAKYDTLKAINSTSNEIVNFLGGWIHHYKFTLNKLENINESFLKDVMNIEITNSWREKFLELIDNGGKADVDWWMEQIQEPSNTIRLIVEAWYSKNNKLFIKCASLNDSLKQFFSELSNNNMVSYSNKVWVNSLISIMPQASSSALSRVLNKLIGMPSTSFKETECIVANCDIYVALQNSLTSEVTLALFENIVTNQQIATWFDLQQIDFESWDQDTMTAFVTEIIRLEGDGLCFEKLNEIDRIRKTKQDLLKQGTEEETEIA